jgi:hypothetical protein
MISLSLIGLTIGCGSNSERDKVFEPASFVVITDLHIGYGIPDYYPNYPTKPNFAWLDKAEGFPGDNERNIYCAEKLQLAVKKIIEEKDRYGIKFVVILGDITDTAEKSEFQRAWQILVKLNDVGIAFIPINGNHDVWPYVQPENNFHPEDRSISKDTATAGVGDRFLEEFFWGDGNKRNLELIRDLFSQSWERNKNPVDLTNVFAQAYLQNFGFSWNKITFIGLDLVPRDKNSIFSNSYPGEASLAVEHKQTIDFSVNYFSKHISSRRTAVLFSHYPLGTIEGFRRYIAENKCDSVYYFSGHQHRNEENNKSLDVSIHEILTEDVAGIDLELTKIKGRENNPIRIVKIGSDGSIDYSTLLSLDQTFGTPSPVPNPIKTTSTTSPTLTPDKSDPPKPTLIDTINHEVDIKKRLENWLEKNKYKLSDFASSGNGLIYYPIRENHYVVLGNEVWAIASAMGEYGFVLYSKDYGNEWEMKWKAGPISNKKPTELVVKDSKNVYVRIKNSTLYTVDGGKTWESKSGWEFKSTNK